MVVPHNIFFPNDLARLNIKNKKQKTKNEEFVIDLDKKQIPRFLLQIRRRKKKQYNSPSIKNKMK